MERKLKVGEVLNRSFAIYRDQAGVLIPVAFWLFLAVAIVEAVAAGDLLLGSLAVVLSLAVSTLYQGMVVDLVNDVRDGRRDYSIGELMRSVAPVVGPLLGAGLLAGLGIVGGFFLLVVPGLYLLTIWAVIAPVIVVERRKVFDAFGRSRQLVRDNGWPVFWTVIVAFLITFAAAILFSAIAVSISDEPLLEIVLFTLASAFTAPIPALVAAVLYFRLREIKGEPPAAESSVPQQPGDSLG
ncbi:MAG: hypothetical protein M3Y75_07160 [Actinomycetota bacterium]|nr:hypothetical protein [Actinomycetota bacterium]